MRENISTAFRQAIQAQQTGEVLAVLVTVDHPDLPEPLRLNNAGINIYSRTKLFYASFLQATIVDADPDRLPQAKLILSNIKREIVAALDATIIPCSILLEIVRASDPDYVEASMSNLEMRNVQGDYMVIQGDLAPKKVRAQPGIDYCFTPSYAPGLF